MKNILLIISIGFFLSCGELLKYPFRQGACVTMKTQDLEDNKYHYYCYDNEQSNFCAYYNSNALYPDGLETKEWLENVYCSDFCSRDSVLTNSSEGSNGCCPSGISEIQAYPDLTCYVQP